MISTALVSSRIFTGVEMLDDHAVIIDEGRISAVMHRDDLDSDCVRRDLGNALIAPGFIDCQVNGGAGALFNDSPTVETIETIGAAHRQFGTTGFLPTLLSDNLDVIERAIRATDQAIADGVPGVLGIHIEGPFLSVARKGIHDPAMFRILEPSHIDLLTSLTRGRTLVTLAPEAAGPELVAELARRGVVVAIGHSDATYQQARASIESGATGVTHLYNAMSQLTGREPGVVGAALEDDATWCALIVDGRHVAKQSLRVALRCKSADRVMLVTDAMPTVGLSEKSFRLYGRQIRVENGVCVSADGTLAGSDLDMSGAVQNTIQMLDLPAAQALKMASANPAAFLRFQHELGRIAAGYRASMVALDGTFNVTETWVDGRSSGELQ